MLTEVEAMCVGTGVTWQQFTPSAQLCCILKTALKIIYERVLFFTLKALMQLDLILAYQVRNGFNFSIFPVYPTVSTQLKSKTHSVGKPF